MNELKEWTVSGVGTGISIRTVAKGADARKLARAWSDPGTLADQRAAIAAWLLVQGGDDYPEDLWLDRLMETYRVRSGEPDDAWTIVPSVLESVYRDTKSEAVLDTLIGVQLDGGPSEIQAMAMVEIFLREPERLDALFAPSDSRPGAQGIRWEAESELDTPDTETAKSLIALRDRQDLPNFRAFMSRLEATQKQTERRRK